MVSAAKKLDRAKDHAVFKPIPPDLNITDLISECDNFHAVDRIDARTITDETMQTLHQLIQAHVIEGGKPLVLENWHERVDWPSWIFNPDWLRKNHGTEAINIRDIPTQSDMPMTLGHYLNNLSKLASKFTPENFHGGQQRLYAKDIDCPPAWQQALQKILPGCTFYLSSNDLMSSLPPEARAENLMCYFGHEGTYTPAHKEMCASLGQNIMVHSSEGEYPGSSIWFMTASGDRDLVAEYWLGGLGHDIEVESHFASIDSFKEAPFPVYIVEQKLGDYILVPPLAPHQVWNRGEATLKVAWNRTTPETLEFAIWESLPKSRLVCRDEQYKNKAIIYETLKHYHQIISREGGRNNRNQGAPLEKMKEDFRKLFKLFDAILLDEEFCLDLAEGMDIEKIPNEFNVTCSFCRGNIFNRFLSCKNCIPPSDGGEEDDVYDVCLECYARGRSCGCISKLKWVEQHDWQQLVRDHDKFRQMVISIEGAITDQSPLEFDTAFEYLGRKSLAWVCQEQLVCRPFVDITKDPNLEDVDDEKEIQRKKDLGLLLNCHVCKIRHPDWKVSQCSNCTKAYCYGNLWRAFDVDPFDALSDHAWKCPVCLGICSCGQCRKNGKTRPYEPKGTMLGASTKHVADPRSVQSLVDFSRGNLGWIQPEHAESLKRKRKSSSMDSNDGEGGSSQDTHRRSLGVFGANEAEEDHDPNAGIPIDPNLETDEIYPMRDHYVHNDDNFDPGSNIGNGQYTSNSVALAERGTSPRPTPSNHQMDGRDQFSVVGKSGGYTKGMGRPRSKQPLLPSPRDMLTGALPSRDTHHSYHSYSHHSHPDSYLPTVYSLSGKSQSKVQRGLAQPYGRQSFTQEANSDDQSLPLGLDISSLEKDPAAFIAAAGLNMLSAGMSLQDPHEPSFGPTASTFSPTTFSEDGGAYDAYFDRYSQPVAVRPGMLMRNPDESEGRDQPAFTFQEDSIGQLPDESSQPLQSPSQLTTKGKRKSTVPSSNIYTSVNSIIGVSSDIIMTEPTKPMREMIVNDWVKKQKLARAKVGNPKGRGRKRKSLIVALKLGPEGWKKWEEQKVEPDLVTKELVLGGGRVHKVLVGKRGSGDVSTTDRGASAATSATPEYQNRSITGSVEPRKRGRPRKNPIPVDVDVDQDDEMGDEEEDELEVMPQPKSQRRESAWIVRKREEEAKEEAANAIENEKRAREKAIEDQEKARLKAIEDEKRRIEEEKQRIEDEKQRIVDEKRLAEETKKRKEEERLQAIEDEKNRKEAERRRAYQEAKNIAAKIADGEIDDGWDYYSEEEYYDKEDRGMVIEEEEEEEEHQGMEEEEEEEEEDEREIYWWESQLPGSSFAVAIGRRPGYHWRSLYITDAELARRPGEQEEQIISERIPIPTTEQPKKKRGRPSKSMTCAVAGDIAPVTQPRRKSMATAAAKAKAIPKKSIAHSDSEDGEFTASQWSQRNKKMQKTERSGPSESVKNGRRTNMRYLDPIEHEGWSAAAKANDAEEMEAESEVSVKVEDEGEGYDDRWKRGGRKLVW